MRHTISPQAKLAEALLRRGMEASARILHSWSSNHGKQRLIWRQDFLKRVRQLVIEIEEEEVC